MFIISVKYVFAYLNTLKKCNFSEKVYANPHTVHIIRKVKTKFTLCQFTLHIILDWCTNLYGIYVTLCMLRVKEITKVIQYFFYTKPSASGISYQIRTQPDTLKTFIVHSNENTILGVVISLLNTKSTAWNVVLNFTQIINIYK